LIGYVGNVNETLAVKDLAHGRERIFHPSGAIRAVTKTFEKLEWLRGGFELFTKSPAVNPPGGPAGEALANVGSYGRRL